MTAARSFAEVVVAAGDVRGAQTFHYEIPAKLEGQVRPGQLVLVPFGTRQSHAVVMGVGDASPVEATRPIFDIIWDAEVLDVVHRELMEWTARRYAAPILTALNLAAPPGLARHLRSTYVPAGDGGQPQATLAPAETRTLELIRQRGEASEAEIRRVAGKTAARAGVRRLVALGLVDRRISLHLPQPAGERMVSAATVEDPGSIDSVLARAPKQRELWRVIEAADAPVPVPQALRAAGVGQPILRALVMRGLARVERRANTPYLVDVTGPGATPGGAFDAAAWQQMQPMLESGDAGAGIVQGDEADRWFIYAQLIERAVGAGRQALVIAPDVRTSARLADWLAPRVAAKVAEVGRARTPAERIALWMAVRNRAVDVLVGTRAAVYAPVSSPGIVIVDREEDAGHKHRNTPRYHARVVARRLAELSGCPLVLGTETPSVQSFHDVAVERSRLVSARSDEATSQPSGGVDVVDMRRAVQVGRHGVISRRLFKALRQVLHDNGRAVLYVNRRGTATLTVCRDCGHVFGCPRCSTGLVQHREAASLQCHVCNWREAPPRHCPVCHGRRLGLWGYGTEAVAEAVSHLFPRARVERVDSDRSARDVEAAASAFERGAGVDVLVGTQRLAGFGEALRASLLGIVQADVGLKFPDFLAPERVFINLMRLRRLVTGGEAGARMVVQTLMPRHHVTQALQTGDTRQFFRAELEERQAEGLPPFRPVARATYAHADDDRAAAEARRARRELETIAGAAEPLDLEILGPAPAALHRRRGQYVWQLLLFGADARKVLPELHRGWTIDVDPIELT